MIEGVANKRGYEPLTPNEAEFSEENDSDQFLSSQPKCKYFFFSWG